MGNIFKSATKLVLLMFATALCLIVGYLAYKNSQSEVVIGALVGVFTTSTWALFGFYFKNSKTNSDTENKGIEMIEFKKNKDGV